ncbi:MAG: HAMP domain-containing protein [Micavibrio sp.]|nr:HAMP domain-containing protein [Micavibrio sp.]
MRDVIKKLLPRTLLGRSLLILIVPVILIQIMTTYIFFDRHWSKMTMRLSYAVAGEIAVIVDMFEQSETKDEYDVYINSMGKHLELRTTFREDMQRLPDVGRTHISEVWENIVAQTLERELNAMIRHAFVMDFDFSQKAINVFVKVDGGVLEFYLPQRRLFSSSGYIFLLWVFAVSLLLLTISIVFMRNQVRPIRRLAVAAERFGKGRDMHSFKASGAREVRQASEAFIDMQRRIKRQVQQRTDMLAGISHDLRTPLTRLKLEIEMLSSEYDISPMKSDVAQMERMIAGYLEFVRGEGDEAVSSVSLLDTLEVLAEGAERQGVEVVRDFGSVQRVYVRPVAFERAIGNIISNGVKYANSKVWITTYQNNNKGYILIEDDGPGIAPELHDEVFKPFKRVDNSRNTETGGVGLGLSIAMDVIQSHGGMIEMADSAYGGLKVAVRLPL